MKDQFDFIPVLNPHNVVMIDQAIGGLAPWIAEFPVKHEHLESRVRTLARVDGVVIDEDRGPDLLADLALGLALALHAPMVAKVHRLEHTRVVRIDPLQGGLPDDLG